MTHWGWYWRIKRNYRPKDVCMKGEAIDSFSMFKGQEAARWLKEEQGRILFTAPPYDLKAVIGPENSLDVHFKGGDYIIPIEVKPCHFGGFYHFFHCPDCKARMRKLYCIYGRFVCRKCAHLGYYSQRLRTSERNLVMSTRVEKYLKARGGSLKVKPPWMKRHTFQKLRQKYVKYDEQWFYTLESELIAWHGSKVIPHLGLFYSSPDGLYDAHVERSKKVNASYLE